MSDGLIVLSVDFELFTHTFAFQKLKKKVTWKVNEEEGVEKLLGLFKKYDVKTTFFTVGNLCQTHEKLLQKISESGHEVASHALSHFPFPKLSEKEKEDEIKSSKKALEKTTKVKVTGFRAPAFNITLEILKILDEAGYKYDSSVIPSLKIPGWYGIYNASIYPGKIDKIFPETNSKLLEFPIATNPMLHMPISGAWMRLLGLKYTMTGINALLKKGAIPVLYVHPWEVIDLPRIKGIPWRVYFRTGETTYKMIEHLIKNIEAEFVSIREIGDYI